MFILKCDIIILSKKGSAYYGRSRKSWNWGNVLYDKSIFVVMPFDWEDEKYYNLCVATRNRDNYDIGDKIWLDENEMVEYIATARIKDFIPKD